MSDKTEIFQVHFFLINKKQTISVKSKMVIGRTEGDIQIPDTMLSSKHCELTPKGLNLFIKDLNSTNGVYVNKMQIPVNKEFRLNFGDIVRLGNEEFVFQDNDVLSKTDTVESSAKPNQVERRDSPRGVAAKISYMLGFFKMSKEWIGVYVILLVMAIGSWVANLHIDAPMPDQLLFLSQMYAKTITVKGIQQVVLVWLLCLVHAYIASVYLKSIMARALSMIPLFYIVLNIVNFVYGPAWYVKNYVEDRHTMLQMEKKQNAAIVDLKKMVEVKTRFQKAYIKLETVLLDEERDIIKKDYNDMIKTIDKKIDSLKPVR
jgi:pSer/pThr/pTyr-binding forkhead associated (FHA) protein